MKEIPVSNLPASNPDHRFSASHLDNRFDNHSGNQEKKSQLTPISIYLTIFFLFIALIAPAPFVMISPGPASDLLGDRITLSKEILAKTFQPSGSLFSTSVYVNSPGSKPRGIEVLKGLFDSQISILPWEVVYPSGVNSAKEIARSKQEMVDSKQSAAQAALSFLKLVQPDINITWKPQDVQINMKDVSGPSAGLAFSLALIAKFADPQLVNGRKIAVTGTISQFGVVGAIGGINQKIIGAKSAGATIFLLPKDNCQDLSSPRDLNHSSNGLQLIAVASLSQAVHALADSKIADSLHC
jgi:PDZ domain-containing protein